MKQHAPDSDDLCGYCYCIRLEHTGLDVDDGEVLSKTCCTHPDHDCLSFKFEGITKKMVDAAVKKVDALNAEWRHEVDLSRTEWYDLILVVLQAGEEN